MSTSRGRVDGAGQPAARDARQAVAACRGIAIGRAGNGADHGEAENPRQDKAQAVVDGHGGRTISQITGRCPLLHNPCISVA
jgi:hypothetical protein